MNEIRVAIVGAGVIGEIHALAFSRLPHARVVAVCDLNEERAHDLARKYDVSAVYGDYRQLLANPEVEAVCVVTPDFAHAEIAIASAEAGKHILVEKPIATTVAEAEAIVRAADTVGVKLMVNFHNRCNPPFVHARQSIQNGEIGRPAYIYARLSNTTFVATQMLAWASQSSVLWFLASHTLDMACWLLDSEPERVYAVSRSGILQDMGVDTPDFYTAIVEFKNGAVVNLENAWVLPESEPMVYNFKFEILGSAGSIYVNTSDHRAMEKYAAPQATGADVASWSTALPDILGLLPTSTLRPGGFMLEAVARFADAVVYDQPLMATGEDGLLVTRVLTAIMESARSGHPIDV